MNCSHGPRLKACHVEVECRQALEQLKSIPTGNRIRYQDRDPLPEFVINLNEVWRLSIETIDNKSASITLTNDIVLVSINLPLSPKLKYVLVP